MKILHVIPGLKNASGPTQAALNLAGYAAADGHEVALAYVSGRGTDPETVLPDGVKILAFPYHFSSKWAFSIALHRYLRQHIQEFDVVHVHGVWLFPNITVAWNARRKKVPYVIRPAGSLDPKPLKMKGFKKRLYLNLIERRLINRAAALHAVSDNEAQNLAALGFQTPIVNIPNGIATVGANATENRMRLRAELNLPAEHKLLLFVGRIHPIKNLEFLGRVFRDLIKGTDESFLLVIAGPDRHEYGHKLKQYYQELGIGDRVYFPGEVAGWQKDSLYRACDVFVLPSWTENFGFVVIEALAAGLPVVVSDTTPWMAVNEANAGYCLPLVEAVFVEKIKKMMTHPEDMERKRLGALQFAKAFAWENINRRMIDWYRHIIAKA